MAVPRIIREYFLFSRRERIAVIILLVLILLVWAAPLLFESVWTPEVPDELVAATRTSTISTGRPGKDSLYPDNGWDQHGQAENSSDRATYQNRYAGEQGQSYGKPYQHSYQGRSRPSFRSSGYNNTAAGKEFWFDPNTASTGDWVRLGVRERTAATIQKYISKGGRFRTPADLERIFGLGAGDRARLIPWVRIAGSGSLEPHREASGPAAQPWREPALPGFGRRRSPQPIDINTADTGSWIALPLIGSKLAARIVTFRDKLGGFRDPAQIREVYGISDSVFQVIVPYLRNSSVAVRKLRLNQATEDELKMHPYVRWELARAIIAYRQAHGLFRSVTDLRKIRMLPEEQFQRLLPYLAVE